MHVHVHACVHTHTLRAAPSPYRPPAEPWLTAEGKVKGGADWTSQALGLLPHPCPALPLALLSAVRINGDGQEVLYLAEGDNVRLGCPYILDPEDYGPNALDIEWMQVNSDPSHRENVVSTRHRVSLALHFVGSTLRSKRGQVRKPRLNFPKSSQGMG